MPVEPADLALAADFAPPTGADWRALVAAVLRRAGTDVDDAAPDTALATRTYDGIEIRPLYVAEDAERLHPGLPGHPPFVRGATGGDTGGDTGSAAASPGWDVRAHHDDPDPARTNRAVLDDLERGATSLWLVLGDTGLAVDDLGAALDGVYLDLAPVALDAGPQVGAASAALLTLAGQRGVLAGLRGSLGADPIGARAAFGTPAGLDVLLDLAEQSKAAPGLRVATVDATVYHRAGASDAQEIGIATAVGLAYLRVLAGAGASVDDALATIDFRFAVTAEQFPSIAKLRAARRVWDRVAELSGASDARRGQYQHAVTSAAALTRRDPWANMLRSTIGCFAAAVGGADAITVLPFDDALGLPDDFARRIARNTQSVLHDESSLARVVDAAGGSWFVESLTDSLAAAAWDVFTAVERAGGALAALDDGTIVDLVGATHDKRAYDIAHGAMPVTGVTEFADVHEVPVERPRRTPSARHGLLPELRYARDFEALRDRADARLAATGSRPAVFLAALGPPSAHSARVAFAANLFQAGGIECLTGPVEAYPAGRTAVACLCSSDTVYAADATPAAQQLRAAGATQIWLAGRAEHHGVDGHLFAGCDALAALVATFDALGVRP